MPDTAEAPSPARRHWLVRTSPLLITGLSGGLGAPSIWAEIRAETRAEAPPGPAPDPVRFDQRPEVEALLVRLIGQYGLDAAWLRAALNRLEPDPRVLALVAPVPGGITMRRRSWPEYRDRFTDPVRIRGGRAWLRRYARTLARAEARFGVPATIITAIVGIETLYGRNTGTFQVLRTLATLGFDFPPRADYFRGELEQFLLYCRDNRIDPRLPTGSFAGAMGIPQFMPTSVRNFAIDFDGDQRIDLAASPADAMGSVANFLRVHGWVPGLPTHHAARVTRPEAVGDAVKAGPTPTLRAAELTALGVEFQDAPPPDRPLVLADLVSDDTPTEWLVGTQNFYAITRYNRSYFYASAVIALADALAQSPDAR